MNATIERLGRYGTWIGGLGWQTSVVARETAAEVESLGYGSLWVSDTPVTKDPLTAAAILLAATSSLVVGTGIANVWGRDAAAMNAAAQSLGEAFPSRFVLGLGVSHQPAVDQRGHVYEKPLAKMRSYLDELDASLYEGPRSATPVPRVLAALREGMLGLSRDRTDGAHPYFVPVEHTARARAVLGSAAWLVPEHAVVVESDPVVARAVARKFMKVYLAMPNYLNSLRWLGFDESDLADGGSDRLVDAIVAWGPVDVVAAKLAGHLSAGADHVLVQPLPRDGDPVGLAQLRALAPALNG